MGYYYSRTDITDSSFYYFDLSHKARWKADVPAANIYGLMAKSNVDISIDTLEDSYSIRNSFAGKANRLAMQNQFGNSADMDLATVDIEYNFKPDYFAYLYNTGLNSVRSANTDFYTGLLDYADSSGIDLYMNRITVLASVNLYFNHQVTEAFRLLYELGEMSVFNDEYFNMLGILALDLHSPDLAVDYFRRTSIQVNERYRLNLGLAYAEAGLLEQADQIFQSLLQSSDASIKTISNEYSNILNWDKKYAINALNDELKYLLFHFIYHKEDPEMSARLFEATGNNIIKTLIQIEKIEHFLKKGKIERAYKDFTEIEENAVPLELETRWIRLKYRFAIQNYGTTADLPEYGSLGSNHPMYLYDKLLYLKRHKDVKDTILLDSAYNILASWDPFFEEGVIASVEYFEGVRGKDNYAYNLLVNSLTVNTYSEVLNKYYIKYCIKEGLIDFARNRLDFIKDFMDGEDFDEYYRSVIIEISGKESEMNSWGS
jgi:hypothetical protein